MSVRDDQLATLNVAGKDYDYYRIADLPGVDHLPYSLKVLVENLGTQHRRREHHGRTRQDAAELGPAGPAQP